jgi:hypothetical protein
MKLTKDTLEEFKAWLDSKGIAHRPGKGEWQVLQVYVEDHGFQVLFTNKRGEYTANDKLYNTIWEFEDDRDRSNI